MNLRVEHRFIAAQINKENGKYFNGREGNASIKSTKSTAADRKTRDSSGWQQQPAHNRIEGIICHRELLITVSAELFRGLWMALPLYFSLQEIRLIKKANGGEDGEASERRKKRTNRRQKNEHIIKRESENTECDFHKTVTCVLTINTEM